MFRQTAAFLALVLSSAASAAPVDAIRAGSMEQMIPEIIAIYEDAGLSWDPAIDWKVEPFTTTYWFYDPHEHEIVTGAVPSEGEVAEYWQTWSDVLTDGNFVATSFFSSTADAIELARYNQFVLATHESAHAITFRYDYPHLERHAFAVNCREYYADRLTVAILNEQALLDPDMERWRGRYLELVTAMGETIPEQYRYHIAHFAALDADCALIDVAQPAPDSMQPYASAYFERYRVLLEADLPPLASVFQTHLVDRWDESHSTTPFSPSHEHLELTTLAELEEVDLGTVFGSSVGASADDRTRVAAFDPSGRLWFASLSYDDAGQLAGLYFGTDAEPAAPILPPAKWHRPSKRLEISSLAVLSENRFVISLHHWDEGGEGGAERYFVTFILVEHVGDKWTLTNIAEVEGMKQAAVLRSPSGRLFMLATPDNTGPQPSRNWTCFEISLERSEVVAELPISTGLDFPKAIDDEGRIYEELGGLLWQSGPGDEDVVLIGNGHSGPRDGVGERAEFSDVLVLQFMPDGRALFIDRDARWEAWLLRELRPIR